MGEGEGEGEGKKREREREREERRKETGRREKRTASIVFCVENTEGDNVVLGTGRNAKRVDHTQREVQTVPKKGREKDITARSLDGVHTSHNRVGRVDAVHDLHLVGTGLVEGRQGASEKA